MSSREFLDIIDRETLDKDMRELRLAIQGTEKSEKIKDFVCDIIDEMAQSGRITNRESVDVAYFVAMCVSQAFII